MFELGEEMICSSTVNFPPADGETARHFLLFGQGSCKEVSFQLGFLSVFGHDDRNILTFLVVSFLICKGSSFLLIILGFVCFYTGQVLFDLHFLFVFSLGWFNV